MDATYTGDNHFGVSTSNTVPLTAQRVPTACTLEVSTTTGLYGTQIYLTGTVTAVVGSQGHAITGTLTFYNGSTVIGVAALPGAGFSATLATTTLPPGADSITVRLSGRPQLSAVWLYTDYGDDSRRLRRP